MKCVFPLDSEHCLSYIFPADSSKPETTPVSCSSGALKKRKRLSTLPSGSSIEKKEPPKKSSLGIVTPSPTATPSPCHQPDFNLDQFLQQSGIHLQASSLCVDSVGTLAGTSLSDVEALVNGIFDSQPLF